MEQLFAPLVRVGVRLRLRGRVRGRVRARVRVRVRVRLRLRVRVGAALRAAAELRRHLLGRPTPVGPQECVVIPRVWLVHVLGHARNGW